MTLVKTEELYMEHDTAGAQLSIRDSLSLGQIVNCLPVNQY